MTEKVSQPPQTTGSLQKLAFLVGDWPTEGAHPQLPSQLHGQSTFEWLREGHLLVWHFDWEEDEIPNAFSVIGYDDGVEDCTMLYSDVRGVARIYQMSLEDGVWKYWRNSEGFSQRMTGTISDDARTITCKGELCTDGTHWERDLDVTYHRK